MKLNEKVLRSQRNVSPAICFAALALRDRKLKEIEDSEIFHHKRAPKTSKIATNRLYVSLLFISDFTISSIC